MTYYICSHCSRVHSAKEWDAETEKAFGLINAIEEDLKDDSHYICPSCKYGIHGSFIKEISP